MGEPLEGVDRGLRKTNTPNQKEFCSASANSLLGLGVRKAYRDLGLEGRVAAVNSLLYPDWPEALSLLCSMKTISLPSPYTWDGASRCTYASSFTTPYKVIIMGRSKKQSTPPSPRGSEPAPPRITSNVKQNLQFLRLWKEFQERKSGQSKPATSYRRKKVQKEDLPEDPELYRDPTMTLYYTNQGIDGAVPVLLVDGYNVCGYWMKLKKYFMKGRLDISRQKLIDELVTFSLLREVKVVVVFDAMMSGLPTHKENFAGIDIVYSGESCADAWIEKEVVALKEDGCPKVWVATSDHCQQHAAYGAGAFVWSSKALISEIKASQREVERMLQEQRSTSFQGKLLKHNLDAEVVDALKDLKRKLSENESKDSK